MLMLIEKEISVQYVKEMIFSAYLDSERSTQKLRRAMHCTLHDKKSHNKHCLHLFGK